MTKSLKSLISDLERKEMIKALCHSEENRKVLICSSLGRDFISHQDDLKAFSEISSLIRKHLNLSLLALHTCSIGPEICHIVSFEYKKSERKNVSLLLKEINFNDVLVTDVPSGTPEDFFKKLREFYKKFSRGF